MSKSKPKSRKAAPTETSAAEFVTVAWMLTTLLCLVCEIGFLVTTWFVRSMEPAPPSLAAMAAVCFFASLVLGVAILALVPVVYRVRRQRPPRSITLGAALIGAVPLALLIVGQFIE